MPPLISTAATGRRLRPRPAAASVVALVAGIALGAVDFLGQRTLPYPWANLANSSAVWAVAAWTLGAWLRTTVRASVLAAAGMLVVAVESYYVTAALTQGDSWANLSGPTTVAWLVFGAVAGVVFGVAGSWWRDGQAWQQVVGAAVPVSVLLAEAALHIRGTAMATAFIELALAGVLLALIAPRPRPAAQIALACLPTTLVGFLALTAFGFHGLGG